ncbi:NAD-dependent epimerase/dehydratase family protein [Mucilaginibacter limnophilus]|uniref:NAD-dependent epimerase/dehydratase family protein n=1 Tax=Mucilaginibacter limnophilus TaxID=1932778 RepID=A0A3S2ULK9_9SPHI|nr:NAD-dependent epimerase/dehydratase family protein [Mucilaginibacter limnophilus]RVT96522.1 NAD-dependent epimerase/dehydratase family protein [Mucilaginibacter limnophilus]
MSKILITGAAGFVGFHLINRLISKDVEIVGLDNINDYYDVNLKFGRLKEAGIDKDQIEYNKPVQSTTYSNYKFVKLDLADKDNILNLFAAEKFDYVVNLAAQAGVRYSLINPYAYIESNVSGFLNILEGCRHNPVKHLIYASSSSVYGANKKIPFSEDDNVDNPVSLYAATKKSNELYAHTYSHLYKIPTTGLRFFTVYGTWGRPDMAYFSFTDDVLKGRTIKVFNHGKMKRDFTYIDDITLAIERLLEKPPVTTPAARVFNIGNNTPIELLDFIKAIEEALGQEAVKEYLPMQPGDVPITYADLTKLEAEIGTMERTDIKTGIKIFVDWYRSYYQQ